MDSKLTEDSLKEMRASLEPISKEAKRIRSRIGDGFLEPPDLLYMANVDSIFASIGAGEVVAPDYTEARKRMREQRLLVESYRLAMEYWRIGWGRGQARTDMLVDPDIIDEVYDTLGDADDEKKDAVEMVVARLDSVQRDLTKPDQIAERLGTWEPENPKTLEEKLFHEVTRLDLGTWKTVQNVRTMVQNIGAKDRKQELICWLGNPDDIPALKLRVKALEDWLSDRSDESETKHIAETLGKKDSYKEKVWLASALLYLIEKHATDERVIDLRQ